MSSAKETKMKGGREWGWLEPGDKVKAGDLVVLETGDFAVVTHDSFEHRAHHAPKWRPPVPAPSLEERLAMLATRRPR